jgi:hypothetical protein
MGMSAVFAASAKSEPDTIEAGQSANVREGGSMSRDVAREIARTGKPVEVLDRESC